MKERYLIIIINNRTKASHTYLDEIESLIDNKNG